MQRGEVGGSRASGCAGGVKGGFERSAGGAGGDRRTDLQLRPADPTSVPYEVQGGGPVFIASERSRLGDSVDLRADDRGQGSVRAQPGCGAVSGVGSEEPAVGAARPPLGEQQGGECRTRERAWLPKNRNFRLFDGPRLGATAFRVSVVVRGRR